MKNFRTSAGGKGDTQRDVDRQKYAENHKQIFGEESWLEKKLREEQEAEDRSTQSGKTHTGSTKEETI